MNSFELFEAIGELPPETVQIKESATPRRRIVASVVAVLSLVLVLQIALWVIEGTKSNPAVQPQPDRMESDAPETDENLFADSIARYPDISFDEAVQRSACAAVGKLLSFERHPESGYVECVFEVKEVLRGEIWENTIHLNSRANAADEERFSLSGDFSFGTYTVGEEYILVMSKAVNTQGEARYGCYCDAYIPVKDPRGSRMCGRELTEISQMNAEAIKLQIRRGY